MSNRKVFNTPGHAHFLTFACWRGQQFLVERSTAEKFLRFLDDARTIEELDLWAYVIMPEHVHLLIRPRREQYDISKILRRVKEGFSREILKGWRNENPARLIDAADPRCHPIRFRFWQPGGGFDRNLWSHAAILGALQYIEANPVRRGLVSEPLDWEWSGARSRHGMEDVPLRIDPVTWEIAPPVWS